MRSRLSPFLGFGFEVARVALQLAHLFLHGHPQVGGSLAEFSQGLAQRAAELRQFARPENQQRQNENEDQFGDADVSHWGSFLHCIIKDRRKGVKRAKVVCYTGGEEGESEA